MTTLFVEVFNLSNLISDIGVFITATLRLFIHIYILKKMLNILDSQAANIFPFILFLKAISLSPGNMNRKLFTSEILRYDLGSNIY